MRRLTAQCARLSGRQLGTLSSNLAADAGSTFSAVCTMATPECLDELELFLVSLGKHHPATPVYVACSTGLDVAFEERLQNRRRQQRTCLPSSTAAAAPPLPLPPVTWVPSLTGYGRISRRAMERVGSGVWYPTRHADFMMEKAAIVEHALAEVQLRHHHDHDSQSSSSPWVLFLDCDVCTMAPWPALPHDAAVGLSPHGIRPRDEQLFGRYNGGVVAVRDPLVLFSWRKFTKVSRFHDQASLEDVARSVPPAARFEFGRHVNYGYWRLMQQSDPPHTATGGDVQGRGVAGGELSRFSLDDDGRIWYDGQQPLQSVHTHLFDNAAPTPMAVFNRLLVHWMQQHHGGGERSPYQHLVEILQHGRVQS